MKNIKRQKKAFLKKARSQSVQETLFMVSEDCFRLVAKGLDLRTASSTLGKWVAELFSNHSISECNLLEVLNDSRRTMKEAVESGRMPPEGFSSELILMTVISTTVFRRELRYRKPIWTPYLMQWASDLTAVECVPLRLRIFAISRVLEETSAHDSDSELYIHLLQRHGNLLCNTAVPEEVDDGLIFLERAVELARQRVNKGINSQIMLGICLHNLGQALCDQTHGDLEKAISVFEECLELDARQADIGAYVTTLLVLVSAVRKTVLMSDDPITGTQKLAKVVDEAEAVHARLVDEMGSPSLYNLVTVEEGLWHNLANAKFDLLNLKGAHEELLQHFIDIRPRYLQLKQLPPGGALSSLARMAQILGTKATPLPHEDFETLLTDVIDDISQEDVLTRDSAVRLSTTFMLAPYSAVSPNILFKLGRILNLVDPVVVGGPLSRGLFQSEALALWSAQHKDNNPTAFREVAIANLELAVGALNRPNRAQAHKEVLGHRVSLLAKFLYHLETRHRRRLELFDLAGANAFASDLNFFGKGGWGQQSSYLSQELYWTRIDYDQVAFVSQLDDLLAVDPSLDQLVEYLKITEGSVGYIATPGVLEDHQVKNPAEKQEELRKDLNRRLSESPHRFSVSRQLTSQEFPSDFGVLAVMEKLELYHGPQLEMYDNIAVVPDQATNSLDTLVNAISEFTIGPIPDDWSDIKATLLETPRPHDAHCVLDSALERVFSDWTEIVELVVRRAECLGLKRIVVLSRGQVELVPWEYLRLKNGDCFGDALKVVRAHTLTETQEASVDRGGKTFQYVGSYDAQKELLAGAAAMRHDGSPIASGLGREEFETQAQGSDVVRLFTHAIWKFGPSSSAFHLGDSPKNAVIAGTSDTFPFFTSGEIKSLDLRGCRRVELWACESARNTDVLASALGSHEPSGLGTAFLLAGASRVLGSWWPQPIGPASLICAFFISEVTDGDCFDEAQALAAAIAAYRDALGPGGVFERAALDTVETESEENPRILRAKALSAGWRATIALASPNASVSETDIDSSLLGFGSESVESRELREIVTSPSAAVERWLEPWRGPSAWAGWRLTARDVHGLFRTKD